MAELKTIGPGLLAELAELRRQVQSRRVNALRRDGRGKRTGAPEVYHAKTTASGVTARSGDTLGEGIVIIGKVDPATREWSPLLDGGDNQIELDVMNIGGAIAGNKLVKVSRDKFGIWSVDVEAC